MDAPNNVTVLGGKLFQRKGGGGGGNNSARGSGKKQAVNPSFSSQATGKCYIGMYYVCICYGKIMFL